MDDVVWSESETRHRFCRCEGDGWAVSNLTINEKVADCNGPFSIKAQSPDGTVLGIQEGIQDPIKGAKG